MVESSEEDIERIASRLAMVVSEDGEAANAGRAIGQLARRLGLTGGDLKQIFMAGAAQEQGARTERANAGEVERGLREITALRASLRVSESNTRLLERERDALQYEVAALRTTLDRRRSGSRLRSLLAGAVVVALAVAAGVSLLRPATLAEFPALGAAAPGARTPGAAGPRRLGVVHAGRAMVFSQPDRGAPVLASMSQGMPVVIHRLLWNMLVQWAEIEVGSGTGYVLTTDIDLS